MKKKLFSILLVVVLAITLVACADTNQTTNGNAETENETAVSEPDGEVVPEASEAENDTVVSEPDGEAVPEAEAVHEHEYAEEIVVAATCTESGTVSYTCECGDTYSEEIEPTGHDWGDYVANGDATYLADGTKTATCTGCGETDTIADDGSKLAYTYTDCEAVKYAQQTVNVRSGPSTDFDKVGSLSTNQEVAVTGTCNETGWYRIVYGDGVAYVSNKYLGDSKVEVSAPPAENGGGNGGAGNSLANHFGVTLPFTATSQFPYPGGGVTWNLLWNSLTGRNPDVNYVGDAWDGTQVTISDLSGSTSYCYAYVTTPNGTSGWMVFYDGARYYVTW